MFMSEVGFEPTTSIEDQNTNNTLEGKAKEIYLDSGALDQLGHSDTYFSFLRKAMIIRILWTA